MPAAPIVGAITGSAQASGDRGRADAYRNQALAEFANIQLPDIEKMKLALEQYTSAGTLTPEMVELISQGPTALEQISLDPRLRQSQLAALEQVAQIAEGGMSPADQAAFELARRNAAAEGQAKQGQILQNLAARGMGGSGAELAASLQNAQSTADRLQQAQLEEARAKQAARMAALSQQANMASGIRSADYGEQSDLASARDAIARFNAANAQQISQSNVGARNQAQAANLQNAQNIRNQNVALSNQQQQLNKNLAQQQFQNQMQRAAGLSGQLNLQAGNAGARAQRTIDQAVGIGQGLNDVAGSVMGAFTGGFGRKA